MVNFVKCRDNVECITNYGLNELTNVLKMGFKVVDSITWNPIKKLGSEDEIREQFESGEIDFIREV